MTLEHLYKSLGGDYASVISRFADEKALKKKLVAFPADPSYSNLCIALKYGNIKEASLSAESLLAICKSLGFSSLEKSLSDVYTAIKNGRACVTDHMLSVLGSGYESTVHLVNAFSEKN